MDIRRYILIINGIEKELLCNDQDSLADVLRQQGLTGTKAACRTGQCGACSIILDKKLVRACTRKMKSVDDYSVIETIEGLGTPKNLHPLQQAFLTYAAVQCGFCSPGFILSAKALLYENPDPTRQEVRNWFTKHNNVCRCTGYKPIVDAVMQAAAVMRGEIGFNDICPKPSIDGRIYGTDFTKPTGLTRVLGTCDYGADIALKMPAGSLHLAVVLAKTHRAHLDSVDYAEALQMPGVRGVITAKDVRGTNRIFAPQATPHSECHGKERPVICDGEINRYGDVIAVVAATSREEARNAAKKVTVHYTERQAIMNFIDAAAKDAEQIHDGIPNIYMEQPLYKGEDTRTLFDSAITVEGAFSTTRQPHLPIEPDVIIAYPQNNGVAIQCKTQYLYGVIGQMAEAIGLENKDIRVIGNPAGGSFGYSMSPGNYALVAVCALALGVPACLDLSYDEHQHMTGKRSPIHANARLACDEEGKLTAMDCMIGLDHGAYSEQAGALTTKVLRFIGYYYAIPNMRALVRTAFTNGNFGIAFRAFGSPQTYMVSEQMIDILANKMKIDPFDFRFKNLAREGELSTTSVPYCEYVMPAMMEMMHPYYDEIKQRVVQKNTTDVKYGVGIALGGYHVSKVPDFSEVDLELRPDNGVNIYSTWADVGQGADFGIFAHVHESLKPLKLRMDQIHKISNDTGVCPDSGSAAGSRSHHSVGSAILIAANNMLDALLKEDGSYRTWEEMQAENKQTRFRGTFKATTPDIDPNTGQGFGSLAQNYIITVVEVAVHLETGKVEVIEAHIGADIGVIGSQHAVLGQAWGGFSHCVGFALSENYEDMKKHATIKGAGIPTCNDIPDNIHVHFHTTPRKNGPHGSTGCAEGFQSCGHVAILNAIANACDVRITTLPATPEKIKKGLEAIKNNEDFPQKPWDLGCDLYERLDFLKNKWTS